MLNKRKTTLANLGGVPTSRQVAGHALTGDVTISPADVGLSNVTNVVQEAVANKDTDATLASNSDTKYPSQKAIKTFVNKAAPSLDALSTPFLVAASQTAIKILANTYIKVINAGVHTIIGFDADTTHAIATALDTGAIEFGKDYYVYVCDDGQVKVSLNSTYPSSYTAANSRKIGGFHTLSSGVGTIASHSLTGFVKTDILPASVWCLNFRPKCSPEGMVYSDLAKIWVDIYLQSSTGATTASLYGAAITDTRVWNDHVDDLAAVGKKLLNDSQFQTVSKGSNQKTNIYGSLDPVTAGKCPIYLSKTGTWAAGVPTSAWLNMAAYVPPVGATNGAQEYVITISTGHPSNPNYFTFQQRNPAGSLGSASAPIQITGAAQALADGLTIAFPAAVGWVTAETATFVVMNGLVDTANRRMISNIGVEAAAGAMYQWLQDQSYRFDIGTPTYAAAGQTTPITYAASPGGAQVYIKFGLDGTPYLCCNMATTGVDKILTFGTNYKVIIKHDANAATGGYALAFYKGGTAPFNFLFNNTVFAKDAIAFSNDPSFMLFLKHDASAGTGTTHGDPVYFDDGADQRLECVNGGASGTQDLCSAGPTWGYQDAGNNEGQVYKQGTYGDAKLLAGGLWNYGAYCGSRCRIANYSRWSANAYSGARGCAEPR
jgi:hypothetical protein